MRGHNMFFLEIIEKEKFSLNYPCCPILSGALFGNVSPLTEATIRGCNLHQDKATFP